MVFIISKLHTIVGPKKSKERREKFGKMIATINLWFSLLIVVIITRDN